MAMVHGAVNTFTADHLSKGNVTADDLSKGNVTDSSQITDAINEEHVVFEHPKDAPGKCFICG
eukprot:11182305-Prorocentrum_lima.AAC.1